MTCKEIEDLLPGMIDGALSDVEMKRIETHLETCASCRKALADLRMSDERVKNLEEVMPPPWLKTRVMAQIRKEARQKEGILRKLFFPLHVKVPIQALATVLIAFVAWNVYKTGEPEFRQMAPSSTAVQEAPKARAPHEPVKAPVPQPEPMPTLGEKAADLEAENRGKRVFAPPPMPMEDQKMRRQATAPEALKTDAAKPAELSKTARLEAAPRKDEEARKGTDATGQQEMDRSVRAPAMETKQKAMKAPVGVAKEGGKAESAPAVSPMMSAAAPLRPDLEITLRARDPGGAAAESEAALNRLGAQSVDRQSREGRVILTARIRSEQIEALREKLKSIGFVQESAQVAPSPGGSLTIRIEIRPE